MRRALRIAAQLAVSAGIVVYLVWQIDVGRTVDLIGSSNGAYLAGALAIQIATTWLLGWRWQLLLASKGIHEPLGWLTKLYFVSYAASQVLPTSIGGDAVRIVEHSRRRPEAKGEAAGAVIMERAIGSAGTLLMVAVGLLVAIGRYDDIGLLVWLEVAFVAATIVVGWLVFSTRARRALAAKQHSVTKSVGRIFPLGKRLWIEQGLRSFYLALHGYRDKVGTLVVVLAVTLAMQVARIMGIWLVGKAVGVNVSPLVYVILGPLLFLVTMVPFTINGLGVREAFFVAFLARFDVGADAAFATGFLFYAVTIATAIPGALILLWRSVRGARLRPRVG